MLGKEMPSHLEWASGRKQYACTSLWREDEERTQGVCLKVEIRKQCDHHR